MLCVKSILGLLTLQTFCICLTIAAKQKAIVKSIQEDINKLKANNVKCTTRDFNAMLRLKCEAKLDKALLCAAEKILSDSSTGNGELWTLLGEIYHTQGKVIKGNKCFKEAGKIHGKFTGQIAQWYFLGPFQIGKTEIDGDPVVNFGVTDEILCQRYSKDLVAYSELVPGGEVKWVTIKPDINGVVTVRQSMVNWQRLTNALVSLAILEWQGWLVGDFVIKSEMTVLIQCLGVSNIYIDGNILVGDVYRRSNYWHPVQLKPGVHSVLLRARAADLEMKFSCNLKPADHAPLFKIHKPSTPDLVDGHILANQFSVPVTNLHASKWLRITQVILATQAYGPDVTLHIDKTQTLTIAPGQIHSIIVHFKFKRKEKNECPPKDIVGVLQLKSSKGLKDELEFEIRCRKRDQSFLFTFLDHDGSLQIAAAIFPLVKGETDIFQSYPVLLTLHGTGIPAQDQADSYKRKAKNEKEYTFGVEGMWTLAPTRHGAHNWEGPGELTAMMSLQRLAEITLQRDWINTKANSKAVVFAGHSMGGHGAWQVSIHHPDIALAVISLAGWNNKESYGESNAFFKHDISLSYTDASMKHVMESCIAENDAEKHLSNLKGIPVLIRTGADDTTVMPYFSRRMYRLLKEQGINVIYTELAKKGHWWWDTANDNDGGVTNDPDIRKFLAKYSKFAVQPIASPACSKIGESESCEDEIVSKYSSKVPNRNLAGSREFLLTVYNPASSHGVRGVQIMQQATLFRKATVRIKFTESKVAIVTSNVIKLRLSEPAVSPVHWTEKQVIVDGVEVLLDRNQGNMFDFCSEEPKNWKFCENVTESERQRGPANFGPARRVAESPLLIVFGTSRKDETTQALLQLAVYIANQFYLTSDAIVPVVRDKDLDNKNIRNYNLIIVGEIFSTASYLESIPFRLNEDQSISLGHCVFQSPNMGILSLVPHAGSRLALVITGTSLSSIRDVIQLATPTIPPMARSPFSNLVPDYVITGPNFKAHGPGGYLCAGFWGNHWEYRSDISSCAC